MSMRVWFPKGSKSSPSFHKVSFRMGSSIEKGCRPCHFLLYIFTILLLHTYVYFFCFYNFATVYALAQWHILCSTTGKLLLCRNVTLKSASGLNHIFLLFAVKINTDFWKHAIHPYRLYFCLTAVHSSPLSIYYFNVGVRYRMHMKSPFSYPTYVHIIRIIFYTYRQIVFDRYFICILTKF